MKKLQKKPKKTFKYLIGIDEVGRGPVAGPVAVCAAIVPFDGRRINTQKIKNIFKDKDLPALRDSKRLSEKGRNDWFTELIKKDSKNLVIFSLHYASAKEIDKRGIAVCIRALVNKNIKKLQERINFSSEEVLVLLDGGLKAPEDFIHQETIIGGDDKEPIISFASIYAKVNRDKLMTKLAKKYPHYGFEKHKGYGTKYHIDMVKKIGISSIHRVSFLKNI